MKTKNIFFKKSRLASLALLVALVLLISTNALAADGNLDPTFGNNGFVVTDFGSGSDAARSVLIQPDGKIVILGTAQGQAPVLMRFNSNGSVDSAFGVNGKLSINFGSKVTLQSNGKLVVAGSSGGSFAVGRYDSDGAGLDTTFGIDGIANIPTDPGDFMYVLSDLAIQPDNKIVLVGTQESLGHTTAIIVTRFTSDGAPDDTFVAHGFKYIDEYDFPGSAYFRGEAVVVQTDGKIVLSSDMYDGDTIEQMALARINPDGSPDATAFGTNGKGTVAITLPGFNSSEGGLALQADGKILVLGNIFNYGSSSNDNLALARFNTNGSLDTGFGGSGIVVTDFGEDENGNDLAVQPDGKIVIVGKSFNTSGSDILLVRYNGDGSLDDTFGVNGKVITDLGNTPDSGNNIALQTDGKLVIAGFSNGNALLARYSNGQSLPLQTTVIFRSTGGRDGWILESTENSGVGGWLNRSAVTVNIGDDRKDRQYRSILSFNTYLIPDNAVVTSAELCILRQNIVGSDPSISHSPLLVDIKNNAFSGNLTLRLTDFNAKSVGRVRMREMGNSWYSAKLDKKLALINKYGVTQFRLRFKIDDDDDMSADYLKFFSGNASEEKQPRLIITYYVP